ncbi:GNAT family N-acetyltransferase [Hyphococcus sp.]|uniref:GNAT family N-acetyltransferase n=1 Tax=Hyphococcus sp. TaxID=2038636 RepID=UPI0020890E14|nr:MAG: N-acetyltransferase [Marinicaulis sp.]
MPKEIIIREAAPDDAEAIREMIAALACETGRPDVEVLSVEEVRQHGFGPHPDFRALIVECEGSPVGLAVYFSEFSTWRGRRGVYIQDIYVTPDQQGAGVGRRLINAVLIRARNDGAVYLRLAADRSNAAAIRFYRRIGFREAREDRIFVLEGEPFEGLTENHAWKPRIVASNDDKKSETSA